MLIAPIGLWHEDAPYTVADWTAKGADELPKVLFHNTDSELVKAALTPPEDEDSCGGSPGAVSLDPWLHR